MTPRRAFAWLSQPWGDYPRWVVILAVLGLLGFGIVTPNARLQALDERTAKLEHDHAILGGVARIHCLTQPPVITVAAGLPCDSLLYYRGFH